MTSFRSSARIVIAAALAACSTSDAVDTRAPSSAVTIAQPLLEIGREHTLMRPSGATRLSNGVLVIVDGFAPAISFFDRTGALLRTVGRKGSGPGEYIAPMLIGQCERDSLFVLDAMQGRVTVLDSAGRTARQFVAPEASRLSCGSGRIAALMMPENGFRKPDPKQPRQRFTGDLVIADTKGEVRTTIENVPLSEFGPLPKVAAIALTPDRVWYSSADSGQTVLYTLRGRKAGTVSLGLPPRKTTTAHYQADIDYQISGFTDRATRETNRRLLEEFAMPEFLPAVKQLVADPHGNVWVSNAFHGDATTSLRVVNAEGQILADVQLPVLLQVMEIGTDYIIGAHEASGEPIVAVYSFDPAMLRIKD